MNRSVILLTGLLAVAGVGGYFAYDRYFRSKAIVSPQVEVADTQQRTAIPVPDVHFTDVTDAAGIKFRHTSGATDKKLLPETMGSGVAVIDYDADGWPDLLFVNSCPWPGQPSAGKSPCLALYRNAGAASSRTPPTRPG